MHIAFVDANAAALDLIRRAKLAGHRVTFLQNETTWYSATEQNLATVHSVDRLVDQVATTDADAVTRALAAVHEVDPLDAVVTQHELCTETTAVACRALGLRGTSPEGVVTARRKERTRAALERAGLASARYAVATTADEALEAADRIGYPVVLKPPSGADSLLAHVAHDAGEAAVAAKAILDGFGSVPEHWQEQFRRGILVEELLVGRLVSVELGGRDGEWFPFGVSGRSRWSGDEVVELGAHMPARLSGEQRDACVAYGVAVCRAIGLDLGVFHLEMMVTERGPVLIEANARAMGGAMPTIYQHATGTNIYDHLLTILDPAAAPVRPPAAFDGCTGGCKAMTVRGGTIAATASLDWLAERPDVLQVLGFEEYKTGPGCTVGPEQVVARFILRTADPAALPGTMDQVLRRLQEETGVELMIGTRD